MEILIPILISLGAFTMIVFLRKFENDERMAMINKGIDFGTKRRRVSAIGTLRLALLAIGISIGLLVGNILEVNISIREEIAYFSMVLLFGGLGLLTSYIIQLKQEEKEKTLEENKQLYQPL
ncbi:hypothetical protein Q0590_02225 [Rhodocytophaga aerolata]|uniref:DUF6249 domain-containing protein n=1 Tax=Rhodocytophaga aerolata TaxID=455078 RepID=A0ABT8R324_9BACT|nr:DUF6249 domain-containing protein [Rhodocytophaga aerolata]MDO1445045.1 hypothetical protein [Rhodocytophaga aerolata]